MASEREDNKALADRLRGKAVSDVQTAGKQLARQTVGKAQTVKEISAPTATPKISQDQNAPSRERHVAEKQQQNQMGSPPQAEQKPAQSAPEKSVSAAGKDKSLGEIAQGLRQAGVTGGRAANDISPAKQTPQVEQKQSRGRGR
jgi:hypothetical protein